MSRMQFFRVRKQHLQFFVHHYWTLKTLGRRSPSLLLPMDHVDLILAPEGTFQYHLAEKILTPQGIHFHGIHRKSTGVLAQRETQVWGVSFQPWGFQTVVGTAMKTFADHIVNLADLNPELSQGLDALYENLDAGEALIDELEKVLARSLVADDQGICAMQRLRRFIEAEPMDLQGYCDQAGVSLRHMQRLFDRYVGVSPKNYLKIRQFEASSREMLYGEKKLLTDISVDSGYYDQSHFIRCFRDYKTYAPKRFREECPASKSELFKN